MTSVKGTCDPAFAKLCDILSHNVASQLELGASLCVNIAGKTVVDIWSGYTDVARTREWQSDTLVNVWSISKTITNLAALMAIDRGLLDARAKVSKYWPAFAANGKEGVEVRHILSHSSGVSGWEQPVPFEALYDLQASTARLAAQAPWWEPGTASGYHALTQGYLVGELIRRTTGKSLSHFIASEIAGPLSADFRLGAHEEDWGRIADLVPPPAVEMPPGLDMESVAVRTLSGPKAEAEYALTTAWRKAEIGAANGHGNARAVARIMSILSLGGIVDGVRFLSPETIDLVFEEQTDGPDLVLGTKIRFGMGYGLPREEVTWLPQGKKCFWGGWGGSIAIMDLDNEMTICYSMNKMIHGTMGTTTTAMYINAIYDIVGRERAGRGMAPK